MKFIKKFYIKIKDFLFPLGTKRRRLLDLFYLSINYIKNYGFVSFLKKVKTIFLRKIFSLFTPKVPNIYKINRNSYVKIDKPLFLPYIDIIIVTYNSDKYINNCINSLINIEYDLKKITLIIIDNNSKDSTKNKINEIFIKSKFIFNDIKIKFNEKNIGFGAGINYGSKLSNSEYLFILNPDTIVDKYCLLNLIKYAINDKYCAIWEARQLPFEHPKFYDPLTLETIWSSAAAMLIKREIFERVKGFDENYFLYVEDVDLSFKVRNLGYCCRYIPEAIVYHFTYSEINEIKLNQLFYSIRNNLLIRIKFNSLKKLLEGLFMIFIFLIIGQKKIKNFRVTIIKSLFSFFLGLPKLRIEKFQNPTFINLYKFFNLDYEYKKYGDFIYQEPPKLNPLVSVIIRSIGENKKMINEALFSVYNQTYKNIEVLLIEDGNNKLIDIVNYYNKNLKIKYIPLKERMGRSMAGNVGLYNAKGDFLVFLDEDDIFYPNHIEVLISNILKFYPTFKAVYSASFEAKIEIINFESYIYRIIELRHFYNDYNKFELYKRNLFPIQSVLFHKSLLIEQGGFREDLELLEDWELWYRYSKMTDFLSIKITTSEFRIISDLKLQEIRRINLKNYENIVRMKYIRQ